ncbi:hypothetical protein QFZ91_005352 [Paraburkholderia sp. JPY419]
MVVELDGPHERREFPLATNMRDDLIADQRKCHRVTVQGNGQCDSAGADASPGKHDAKGEQKQIGAQVGVVPVLY